MDVVSHFTEEPAPAVCSAAIVQEGLRSWSMIWVAFQLTCFDLCLLLPRTSAAAHCYATELSEGEMNGS